MLRVPPDYELLLHSADNPILLAGPPDALTGEVYMANPGNQHVVLRSVRLRELPQPTTTELEIPMVAILRAGQSGKTRIKVSLSPFTAPGHYKTNLVLGNYTYPAELHVIENVDLEIVPSQLVLENRPGTRAEKQVMFRNTGNTQLTITSAGALVTDEELMTCRILRGGLAVGTESGANSFDQWLTAFMREAHRNVREAGMLHVSNKEGETVIPPGESRDVVFVIRQPDTQRANARYFSVAFFYTANLIISLVPGGASKTRSEERSTEPRYHGKARRSRSRT